MFEGSGRLAGPFVFRRSRHPAGAERVEGSARAQHVRKWHSRRERSAEFCLSSVSVALTLHEIGFVVVGGGSAACACSSPIASEGPRGGREIHGSRQSSSTG